MARLTVKEDDRQVCGPRLLARLSSTAWRSTEGVIDEAALYDLAGAEALLAHLERTFGRLKDTTLFSALDAFFYGHSRAGRESLIEFFSGYHDQMRRVEIMINDYLQQEAERSLETRVTVWKLEQADALARHVLHHDLYMQWMLN